MIIFFFNCRYDTFLFIIIASPLEIPSIVLFSTPIKWYLKNPEIKPTNIYQQVDGCEYCKYRDICYRRNSDINYQSIYEAKEGDDDE